MAFTAFVTKDCLLEHGAFHREEVHAFVGETQRTFESQARRTRRWLGSAGVGVVLLSVVMALVAVLVGQHLSGEPSYASPPASLALLTLMFGIFELLRVDIFVGPNSHAVTMSELAVVVGVLTGRPLDTVVAHTIAVVAVFGVFRRVTTAKVFFNAASVAATTAVGVLVMRAIGGSADTSVRVAVGAVVGGLAIGLLNYATLLLGMRLAGQRRTWRELTRDFATSTASVLAASSIGVQIVFLGRVSSWLVLLAVAPLGLMYSAFRSYAAQRRLAERNEFLHQSTAALHTAASVNDGLLDVLERTRGAAFAEFCRLILFAPEGDTTIAAYSSNDEPRELHPAPAELAGAARLLHNGIPGPCLLDGGDVAGAALLAALGLRTGIVAPLPVDEERSGLLVVGNRHGDLDEFRRDDARMIGLVANQLGVALTNRRLERSLKQLAELERRLHHQAKHDGLTGIANRRFFNERMEEQFARRHADGHDDGCAVLLIDLDDFKRVNDTYGHPVGDELLAVLSQRIASVIRSDDLLARIGGDEFAVALGGAVDHDTICDRARAIIETIRRPVHVDGVMLTVRSSIGAALAEPNTRSPEDLLRDADAALYRAKELGKDQFVVFDVALNREAKDRRRMNAAMAIAVRDRTFNVLYQPVHDLVSGEVVAIEALVRWKHPDLGELRPSEFLHLAEASGLVVDVGHQVLEEGARVLTSLIRDDLGGRRIRLNVNLAAQQLGDAALAGSVTRTLKRYGLEPDLLVFEASEAALLADIDRSRTAIRALMMAGIRISLDDFGVGSSSLGHVRELPFGEMKINGAFVGQLPNDKRISALVGAIIHFSNALGVSAVAEGITSLEQLAELRRHGCRYGQGPLMSPPLTEAELRELLSANGNRPIWAT